MIIKQADVLSTINYLANDCEYIDVLWLYGSRAKGTQRNDSDYDLAMAINENKHSTLESSNTINRYFADQLASEWSLKAEVAISIIDINQVPTPLAYNVINDGKIIKCTNDFRLHAEEQRIWSLWEEYKYEYQRFRQ